MEDENAPTEQLLRDDERVDSNQAEASADVAESTSDTEAVEPTKQIPAAEEAPRETTEEASLRDVIATAGRYAQTRLAKLQALLLSKKLLVIALVAVIACAGLAWLGLYLKNLADLPDPGLFRKDAQSLLTAPAYEAGAFDYPEALTLADFEATERTKQPSTPDECLVKGVALYSNDAIEALQETLLTYTRQEGTWQCTSAEPVGGLSYRALVGVDQNRVIDNTAILLQRAEAAFADDDNVGLPTLYANASVDITDSTFDADAHSDSVTLHLVSASDFTSYECDVDATFVFRPGNGQWELTSATASPDAKKVTLAPLVGSWSGSFEGQDSSGSKCFGAKEAGLRITVTSAEDGRIAGTVTCTAHYHENIDGDIEAHEDDTVLEDVPFTGTLAPGGGGIVFDCTTPEDARGVVRLSLTFGTQDDPSAAHATVTTRHPYTATFLLIPYQRKAEFADTFTLTRQ